jgi:hypothetical protein
VNVKYTLILFALLFSTPCHSQATTTGKAETSGPCSPAVSGNNNQFTINCPGISKEQGQKMLDILNKILKDQLDPQKVMIKLDEIENGIRQLAAREWAELTGAQIQDLCSALDTPAKEKVQIVVANEDENRLLLANQLRESFRCAKSDADVTTMVAFRAPNSPIPSGIEIDVKEETALANTVKAALIRIFGRDAVKGNLNNSMQPDVIHIYVSYRPRQ